jgi:hypothetical protein
MQASMKPHQTLTMGILPTRSRLGNHVRLAVAVVHVFLMSAQLFCNQCPPVDNRSHVISWHNKLPLQSQQWK